MMRFEFDDKGYVSCILYGCYTGNCMEYSGLVPNEPEQYADMDDWADRAQIQAYYLDHNGNLAYDAIKASKIPDPDCIEVTPYTSEQAKSLGIFDLIYPVGSIYMSVNDVSPETLFGVTWQRIEDKFILASGSTFNAGDTGGEASYDLEVSHKHIAPVGSTSSRLGLVSVNGTVSGGNGKSYQTTPYDSSGTLSSNVTLGYTSDETIKATIPTLPPYMAVFVWQRVEDDAPEDYESFIDRDGDVFTDANTDEFMVEVI